MAPRGGGCRKTTPFFLVACDKQVCVCAGRRARSTENDVCRCPHHDILLARVLDERHEHGASERPFPENLTRGRAGGDVVDVCCPSAGWMGDRWWDDVRDVVGRRKNKKARARRGSLSASCTSPCGGASPSQFGLCLFRRRERGACGGALCLTAPVRDVAAMRVLWREIPPHPSLFSLCVSHFFPRHTEVKFFLAISHRRFDDVSNSTSIRYI